jgi:phosphoribosylanthranilate isomerase
VIRRPNLPSPSSPWIKVCGVRSFGDLEACARAGATHIGLNAWPRSPRFVPRRDLLSLIGAARSLGLAPVVLLLPGAVVSLEEAEGAAFVQVLAPPPAPARRRLAHTGTGVVEARPVTAENAAAAPFGDALLLDAHGAGRPGGTGRTFPWALAGGAPRPFVLAGGLGPDNVSAAIAACAPSGVDAASGLEAAPGIKDGGRILAFCSAAREALALLARPEAVPPRPSRPSASPLDSNADLRGLSARESR